VLEVAPRPNAVVEGERRSRLDRKLPNEDTQPASRQRAAVEVEKVDSVETQQVSLYRVTVLVSDEVLIITPQGIGLRQAKDWIDWHIDQDPMLRAQLEARQRETRRKFFFWFLLIDALIVAAVIAWFLYTPR